MSAFLSMKLTRLVLAFSVSLWMAGGCLFGCSNAAMGMDLTAGAENSAPAVVADESCHSAASHDCCSSKKPKRQSANSTSKAPQGVPSFVPGPQEMMKDCPLGVNATAATSKSSTHLPDPGRGPVAVLPFIGPETIQSETFSVISIPPNRGPTYLLCCVFLI